MKRIEIETITEAMATKQTWLRKGLDDFLQTWKQATGQEVSGHDLFVLYEYGNEDRKRLVLKRGMAKVDGDTYDHYNDEWVNWDNYLELDNQSITRIKKIIDAISSGINDYFRNIQNDIDALSESGQEIARITKALEK